MGVFYRSAGACPPQCLCCDERSRGTGPRDTMIKRSRGTGPRTTVAGAWFAAREGQALALRLPGVVGAGPRAGMKGHRRFIVVRGPVPRKATKCLCLISTGFTFFVKRVIIEQ